MTKLAFVVVLFAPLPNVANGMIMPCTGADARNVARGLRNPTKMTAILAEVGEDCATCARTNSKEIEAKCIGTNPMLRALPGGAGGAQGAAMPMMAAASQGMSTLMASAGMEGMGHGGHDMSKMDMNGCGKKDLPASKAYGLR